MAELKTKATASDVATFLDSAQPPQRAADARVATDIMARVTGEPATMWGPAIVGFGHYHYRYDSGREGDMCRIGLSPRKAALTLYVNAGSGVHDDLLPKLGKHTTGKGCLYIKKLADVDAGVLEEIVRRAWAQSFEQWPGRAAYVDEPVRDS